MHTLLRAVPLQNLVWRHLPVVAVSLIIAELFYKLHSFSLELLAFAATWYGLDYSVSLLIRHSRKEG
jgi:hypothetical protein